MDKLTDNERNKLNEIDKRIMTKGVSNAFLLELIELGFDYLGLLSISDYAKENKMSYNGVKNNREIHIVGGKKWIINN